MTNHEKYEQAFAAPHPSAGFSLEAAHTSYRSKLIRAAAAASAACLLLAGAGGIAYAADAGGIQRTMRIWMQGEWILSPYKYPEPDFDAVSAD